MSDVAKVHSVPAVKLLKIAISVVGLNAVPRKGYVKLYPAGKQAGPCLQVWLDKANENSSQIDLVNFEHPTAIKHKHADRANWYKSVAQQMDMTKDVAQILKDFYVLAKAVATAQPASKDAGQTIAELMAKAAAKKDAAKAGAPEVTKPEGELQVA